jgi:hypothetical protein
MGNDYISKEELANLLKDINDCSSKSRDAKNKLVQEFRKYGNRYEEFLFDVISYCEAGHLFTTLAPKDEVFNQIVDDLYKDMIDCPL